MALKTTGQEAEGQSLMGLSSMLPAPHFPFPFANPLFPE